MLIKKIDEDDEHPLLFCYATSKPVEVLKTYGVVEED